jgi:hypothetical protein
MSLHSTTDNKTADFVMSAWIAGIQIRKDASRNIRVSLDSSTPCWNDAIEGTLLEMTEVPPPGIFKEKLNYFLSLFSNFPQRLLEKTLIEVLRRFR